MKRLIIALLVPMAVASTSHAGSKYISASNAHNKAVDILFGDPYGNSFYEVSKGIVAQELGPDKNCGKRGNVWTFHVKVFDKSSQAPIEGTLILNARNGKLICAGLPYLD